MSDPLFRQNIRAAKCFGKKVEPKLEEKDEKPKKKKGATAKKRAKQEREYSKKRKEFLSINRICLVAAPGCTKEATTVHHIQGRMGKRLTDKENFLPCCINCHEYVENNPLSAKDSGMSRSRLTKNTNT